MNLWKILFGGVVATAAMLPAAAFACSCSTALVNQFQIGGEGVIPVNALGVAWHTNLAGEVPADKIWVEQVEGDTRTRVDFAIESPLEDLYLIRPANWAQGHTYRIHAETDRFVAYPYTADDWIREVEVQVGPPVTTEPTGDIFVDTAKPDSIRISSNGGGCDTTFEGVGVGVYMRNLEIDYGLLLFTTTVDGKAWAPRTDLCEANRPGESWVGRGQDRLVAVCDDSFVEDFMLAPGSHTVSMSARLPGTDIIFTSEKVTVELTCPEPTPVEESSETGGGCQSTHGSTGFMPLLVLFGFLGRRRRRSY